MINDSSMFTHIYIYLSRKRTNKRQQGSSVSCFVILSKWKEKIPKAITRRQIIWNQYPKARNSNQLNNGIISVPKNTNSFLSFIIIFAFFPGHFFLIGYFFLNISFLLFKDQFCDKWINFTSRYAFASLQL